MSERPERTYPARPLAGVGAVVWDGSHVLLERRGRPPAQGSWSLPGGLIEVGETAAAALQREVSEECGIEIAVGPVLGLFEPILRDADGRTKYHYIVIDFLTYYLSGEIRPGDDADELRWVSPEEIHDYQLTPEVANMIQRGLALVK